MARCRATTPCDFYDDVHDFGCPQRGLGFSNPDAARLYATATAEEHAVLGAVLEFLIDRDLLDTTGYDDATADDVTGGEAEWLELRRRIRDLWDVADVPDGFAVRWDDADSDTRSPELYRTA